MDQKTKVVIGAGVLIFAIIIGLVFVEIIMPTLTPFEDGAAARLTCTDQGNVSFGSNPINYSELPPDKQKLVERAIEGDRDYPGLNRSQVDYFESHSTIVYENTTYVCGPEYS